MKRYPPINIGDTFHTAYSGDCKVIDVFQKNGKGLRYYTVEFPTGSTRTVKAQNLRDGTINDPLHLDYKSQPKLRKHTPIKVGDTFTTNEFGDCEVVDVEGHGTARSKVTVRFIQTNGIVVTSPESLRKGVTKDRFAPTVFGRGFLGNGSHKASDPAYDLWYAVMQRCYNPNYYNDHTEKSYADVEVCPEWYNFQTFADFYVKHYKDGYQLDKDILKPGCKVYSPDTCMFVPRTVNNAEAILRTLVSENPAYAHVMKAFRQEVTRQDKLSEGRF